MSHPVKHGKHVARKRFGQHFLADKLIIEAIVDAINPKPGQAMVEIGPGLAALTQPLVERLGHLTVIELDRDLAVRLREHPKLNVIESDVLKVDFKQAALAQAAPKLRVVGNLPYNISTPILFHLLEFVDVIEDQHFMLQKEVVDRMCAAPDSSDYGRLTVALAARAQCLELFRVGPQSFDPPPKVDSAVVRVIPRAPDFAIADLATFDKVVAVAFAQRRKTLGNALKTLLDHDGIREAGVDPVARAETLPPEAFARLTAVYLRRCANAV